VERLAAAPNPQLSQVAAALGNAQFDDQQRFRLLLGLLQTQRILLVLDNFEDNLVVGGGQYKDQSVPTWLGLLCESATPGKLLITSRYPLPGLDLQLAHQPLGPLSPAQVRKLMWRHAGLKALNSEDAREVLRHIGGHPRMLEFLDGILRGGTARLPRIAQRLRTLAQQTGLDLSTASDDLDSAVRATAQLGARDILLDELLQLARAAGDEPALLQAAVSSLTVTPRDLAHALNDAPPSAAQVHNAQLRLERLADLSLVSTHRADQDATGDANHAPLAFWVHRWTAEALAAIDTPEAHRARHARAGRARLARRTNQVIALDDIVEATHNFLAAELWDEASELALQIANHLVRTNQSIAAAAFCAQILRELPKDHDNWAALADVEARCQLSLGFTSIALARYQALLLTFEERVQVEPNRADHKRTLSAIYNRLGDLLSTVGQGEQARGYYERSFKLFERLAQAEPDRADYQRDLSVSYERMGDLLRTLGQGEQARSYYERSLSIWSKLMALDSSNVDYQRGICVPLDRLGDLLRTLGQGEQARGYYERSLKLRERLAQAEPDRADYQRDLSVSYNKLGELLRTLGQGEQARGYYERSLQLTERLAQAEPDRADYQRDLVISLVRTAAQLGRVEDAERAVGILHRLRESGRLAPVDAGMVADAEALRDLLAKAGLGGEGQGAEP
jgi:tetratricopeptide (TPR) repeat protein